MYMWDLCTFILYYYILFILYLYRTYIIFNLYIIDIIPAVYNVHNRIKKYLECVEKHFRYLNIIKIDI